LSLLFLSNINFISKSIKNGVKKRLTRQKKIVLQTPSGSKKRCAFFFGKHCWQGLYLLNNRHLQGVFIHSEKPKPIPQTKNSLLKKTNRKVVMNR
jgi:hypothetical protein